MFKKLLIISGLAAALAVPAAQAADTYKVIRAGTEAMFAPFEFMDGNELVGFDIDIINAIGKATGIKVEMMAMQFDGLIPAIISGSLDCAIAGFTKNPERARRVDFSDPYYVAGQDLMIKAADKGKITSFKDLENRKVCVQIGSVGALLAADIKGAKVTTFNSMTEAYLELAAENGCDAAITGTPVNQYYLVQTGDTKLVHVPESVVNAADLGIVVKKGNKELLDILNAGLKQIKEDGTYDQLYQKWFVAGSGK